MEQRVQCCLCFSATQVNQVNLFFYNIPSSGVGLPVVELYWGDTSQRLAENLLSHVIVENQDLSQDDRTLRSVSLVIRNNTQTNYESFRICFIFPETSLIDRIILSEVQFCEEAGVYVCVIAMHDGMWVLVEVENESPPEKLYPKLNLVFHDQWVKVSISAVSP